MTALYLFGAFLVLLLAGVVLAPLIEREPPDRELEELPPDERREAAVEALAEIEFEYRTDKLSEEDYRRHRTHYGRIALAAEEEMEGDGPETGGEAPPSGTAEAGGSGSDGARTAGSCPGCGSKAPDGARFCPRCGERLRGER